MSRRNNKGNLGWILFLLILFGLAVKHHHPMQKYPYVDEKGCIHSAHGYVELIECKE